MLFSSCSARTGSCCILDPGSRIQDQGSRIQHPGSRIMDPTSRIQDPGSGILEQGPRIQDPGSRLLDPGWWNQDAGSAKMQSCHGFDGFAVDEVRRSLTKFDEVWRRLTKFDKVWRSSTKFDEIVTKFDEIATQIDEVTREMLHSCYQDATKIANLWDTKGTELVAKVELEKAKTHKFGYRKFGALSRAPFLEKLIVIWSGLAYFNVFQRTSAIHLPS